MTTEITSKIFKNSLNKACEQPQSYSSVVHVQMIEFKKLCRDISATSSLNPIHIKHALLVLHYQTEKYIENG